MIKLIATGVWILLLTLGGVYAAATFGKPAVEDHHADAPPPQYIQSELMTLPVLSGGKVSGYFLLRTTLVADAASLKEIKVPIPAYVTDTLYGLLVGDRLVDVQDAGKFDVAGFKARIKDGLNATLEKPLVQDVLIEQMDFLSKDAIDSKDSSRKPEKIVIDTDPPPPKAATTSASH